jgi:regulator of protease activity HflC (stomatin/prohibitin superfamily)
MDTLIGAIFLLGLPALIGCLIYRALFETATVWEYQRAVLFKDGKVVRVLEPGRHRFRRRNTHVSTVDMRERTEKVEGQEILTADGAAVRVSLVAEFRAGDPIVLLTAAQKPDSMLYLTLQIALREIIAGTRVDELVEHRVNIGEAVMGQMVARAAELGWDLRAVSVRDITFPGALKRTMALILEARKEAEASLERARGEAATMRSLANTATMMQRNPGLLQLRLLQALAGSTGNSLVLQMDHVSISDPTLLPEKENQAGPV